MGEKIAADKLRSFVIRGFVLLLIILNFNSNIFAIVKSQTFENYQRDSEALVLGGIHAQINNWDIGQANLARFAPDNDLEQTTDDWVNHTYKIYQEKETATEGSLISQYKSSFGIQSILLKPLVKIGASVGFLHFFVTVLFVSAMAIISKQMMQIFDVRFALIFALSLILSPSVIQIANNLYWLCFLWVLPAIFSFQLYLSKTRSMKALCVVGVVVSVFVKSLGGYEFLTMVTLLACMPFILAGFFHNSRGSFWQKIDFKMFSCVFAACVLGFLGALMVHATLRGETVVEGVSNIILEDVLRRTYNVASVDLPEVYTESLEASVFWVLIKYVLSSPTGFLLNLDWLWFFWGAVFSLFGLVIKYKKNHPTFQKDIVLYCYGGLISATWLVLAKGHSYIHTHINYVLWYFGFVPAILYVGLNTIMLFRENLVTAVEKLKLYQDKDF